MPLFHAFIVLVGVIAMSSLHTADTQKSIIRVGILGCDTSHCVAFTKILNNPGNTGELANVRVVAAWPGGSADLPESINRVSGYVAQLNKEYQVEIVDTISDLLSKVDAVLLESVDGRPHWEQVQPVLRAKKPVFIDKPMAASLADAMKIFKLSEETGTPCFSSSALRYTPNIAKARSNEKLGKVIGCFAYSPCTLNKYHPDLFWYGIHGVETLFTIMGTGCDSVQRTFSEGTDVVTGTWKDGRIGTFRGIREGTGEFGALIFGSKSTFTTGTFTGYQPLVTEIARFFRTHKAPVSPEETLEILAFMEAADLCKQSSSRSVKLSDVMERAKRQINPAK